MPTEIEAKFKLTEDESDLVDRLKAAGAVRGPRLREVNRYFDTPTGTLRRTDQGLRVRVEKDRDSGDERVIITHKGRQGDSPYKSRLETELIAGDGKSAVAFLEALGFTSPLSFEKDRQKWTLNKCVVDVDTLPYLGRFVEIEGTSDRAVGRVIKLLKLDHLPVIKSSYISMLRQHAAANGITATHLRLKRR